MTERPRARVERSATSLRIGPSALRWRGATLEIDIDEVTMPWPGRIRGRVTLTPGHLGAQGFDLDARGTHRWNPIAPVSRVDVELERPGLAWSGPAYFDSNRGAAPLEAAFSHWHWSRAMLADGRAAVLYDATRVDGSAASLALLFDAAGHVEPFSAPPEARLPPTLWRIDRGTRCDAGGMATVRQTLEDAPFYARSLVQTHLCGEPALAVHETLSLRRFDTRWVQAMLPFRMPRSG